MIRLLVLWPFIHYARKCVSNVADCKCDLCQEVKKKTIELSRKGLANAQSTFGPIKRGIPSKKKPIKLAISTDVDGNKVEPYKLNKENWLFATGTPWKHKYFHNERCEGRCKCDEERRNTN